MRKGRRRRYCGGKTNKKKKIVTRKGNFQGSLPVLEL
jgi:hypothetical protein